MCGEQVCEVVSDYELTNNDPSKRTMKEVVEGGFLPHQNDGVGNVVIPPTIKGRVDSLREHRCGGILAIVMN